MTVDPPSGFQGSSTAWGHNNSRLGAAVGAAAYWNTPAYNQADPLLTSFSSWGGTPIFFEQDENGETIRLPEPEIRQQPQFTAPQEGNTTFFGYPSYEYRIFCRISKVHLPQHRTPRQSLHLCFSLTHLLCLLTFMKY